MTGRARWRLTELALLLPVGALLAAGGLTLALQRDRSPTFGALMPQALLLGLLAASHFWLVARLPETDQTLLPLVGALSALGLTMVDRIQPALAPRQALWLLVSTLAWAIVVAFPRPIGWLARYRYTWATLGIALLGSTLALGVDPNDSGVRIWLGYGGYYFQPSELIKILLVIFLASYLDDVRGLVGGPSIGGRRSIRVAYLLPVALLGGMCLLLLLVQRDLGPAVLFYAVTLTLLYLATERALYVALGLAAFGLGATVVYRLFAVAQLRIDVWRDPWVEASGRGYQIVQGLVALANGGLLGTGLGRGHPEILPAAYTDFPFAVIGEELGFVGAAGVIGLYGLVALRGYAIAARTSHPFSTLLAAGLTTVLSFQAFIILAGNLKLLPLTGITLPFVSFGGSSLLTNFLILGLLHRISAEPTIDGPRAPPR